ncbi:hypothetical protein PLESTB_000669100 [Pleodorina starrii]|uniref:Uncharacterized protein n=1 Tax=Pleodorina starrii TaxID=330485 RepID=A0A9W6BJ57_9CHLO|nr:hypothetical protein PLESTB_000669100 [Pleodorina starrii]GLC65861.1 hypothetical protein PLESTF_000351500 [Pleodorina starrii]
MSPPQPLQPLQPPQSPPERSPAASPIQPTTCQVVLIGDPSAAPAVQILQAVVQCRTDTSGDAAAAAAPINVTIGRRLLPYSANWRGVVVSQRPGDAEWGLTFNDVPYMRLQESVVQDLPYSRAGPLLQCSNCSRLELVNVTVAGLRPPSGGGAGGGVGALYGPIHATNVSYAGLRNFTCADVRDAHGWACVLLQYNMMQYNMMQYNADDAPRGLNSSTSTAPGNTSSSSSTSVTSSLTSSSTPQLSLVNCVFRGNSVTRKGQYGTVLQQPAAVSSSGPPSSSPSLTASRAVGLGLLVVNPFDAPGGAAGGAAGAAGAGVGVVDGADAGPGPAGEPAAAAAPSTGASLAVWLEGVSAADNAGGLGTVLSIVNVSLGRITLRGCAFSANSAAASGGVIAAVGVGSRSSAAAAAAAALTMTIQDSRFEGNAADAGDGGAIFLGGGAAADSLSFAMENSSFLANRAEAGSGGALCVTSRVSEFRVAAGSTFDRNFAGADGGALALLGGLDSLIVTGASVVSNNQAARGGAIWVSARATAVAAAAAAAASPPAAGTISIEDGSALKYNWAHDFGGVIAVEGGLGHLTLQGGSYLSHNHAGRQVQDGGGGAVAVLSGDVGGVTLAGGSSIAECSTAYGNGGAVLIASGSLGALVLVDGSQMYGNTAVNGSGGAVAVYGTLAMLEMSSGSGVHDNSAAVDGGGVWAGGGVAVVRLTAASAAANRAGGSGGFLFTAAAAAVDLRVDGGSQLIGNTAGLYGGALLVVASYGNVTLAGGAVLKGNAAERGSGGALCLMAAPSPLRGSLSLDVSGSSLSENSAGRSGGAISFAPPDDDDDEGLGRTTFANLRGAAPPAAEATFDALDASDTRVGEPGSALWSLRISDSVLQGNSAYGGAGGAVLAAAGAEASLLVVVEGCELEGNRAAAGGGGRGDGGVVRQSDGSGGGGAVAVAWRASDSGGWLPAAAAAAAHAAASPQAANQGAETDPGAILLRETSGDQLGGMCHIVVSDSTFTGNVAVSGGGGGALLLELCTAVVDRCAFSGNAADGASGGAVAAAAAAVPGVAPVNGVDEMWWYALLVRESRFEDNTARGDGGAVATATSGMVGFRDCVISRNRAGSGGGGGVAAFPPANAAAVVYGTALELVSCSVESNSAGEHGGGVLAGALSAVRLYDSSVSYNNAAGGNGGGVAVVTWVNPYSVPPLFDQQQQQQQQLVNLEIAADDSALSYNAAPAGDGGGLYLSAEAATAALRRVAFSGNAAGGVGAAAAAIAPAAGWAAVSAHGDLTLLDCQPGAEVDEQVAGFFHTPGTFEFVRLTGGDGSPNGAMGS